MRLSPSLLLGFAFSCLMVAWHMDFVDFVGCLDCSVNVREVEFLPQIVMGLLCCT